MKYVADLHLHSKFSRAVSPNMTIPTLAQWGRKKGIKLLSTSDFTHPIWFNSLKEELVEDGTGFYKAKNTSQDVRFVLGTELSCIYPQGGKLRRIHILVFAPNFPTVEKINQAVSKRGKLASDGRPIFGMSAKELTSILLGINPDCLIVPAHCWTPWFALYGSNSGFDSIEECFGDLSKNIYAIETGLSSDPSMNWRLSELDNRAILSFSDAHSPAKVGREATIFEGELSYKGLIGAIRGIGENKVVGTTEFFPEEGKYHFTGHRSCGVKQDPKETKEKGEICPVCQRRLTVGVMHRVEQLADRIEEQLGLTKVGGWIKSSNLPRAPFRRLVPLQEIIAEALGTAPSSQKVVSEFEKLVNSLGSEIEILLRAKREDIEKVSHPRIAEGIEKVRNEDIIVDPGFDGVYGVVKIWPETKREAKLDQPKSEKKPSKPKDENQLNLFGK